MKNFFFCAAILENFQTKIARNAAFNQLLEKQSSHKKIKHIAYKTLEVQQYLKSDLLTQKHVQTLNTIRSHCLKGIKEIFFKNATIVRTLSPEM